MRFWPFNRYNPPSTPAVSESPNPAFFGSVIAANGQPGTGKTYLLFRLVCTAGFKHRLPVILQDTRGDLSVYHAAAIRSLAGKTDKVSRLKRDFLTDKSRFVILNDASGESFLSLLSSYYKASAREVNRTPKAFALVDEGGVLRRGEETFWDISSGFRNAGITAFTSVHKDTDISRVGRQCLRAVILQRPYEGTVDFFGKEIPAEDCSPPMSDIVTYIDSLNREVLRFDITKEQIPECLTHPVQPTRVKEMKF